ncbi:MAG TPA: hypothetical protein VE258_05360, partial [Ktedonobacterales bacterium]|nr:hypothetical protein [Ktedonobacterales bacterium]
QEEKEPEKDPTDGAAQRAEQMNYGPGGYHVVAPFMQAGDPPGGSRLHAPQRAALACRGDAASVARGACLEYFT